MYNDTLSGYLKLRCYLTFFIFNWFIFIMIQNSLFCTVNRLYLLVPILIKYIAIPHVSSNPLLLLPEDYFTHK